MAAPGVGVGGDPFSGVQEKTARTEAVPALCRAARSLLSAGLLLAGPGRLPKNDPILEDLREAVGFIKAAREKLEARNARPA